MIRFRKIVPVVAAGLLLAGCASLPPATAGGPDEGATLSPDLLARLAYVGIAPELIRVTDIDGFTVATQSVGVSGDDGVGAFYVADAGTVMLRTSRGATPDAVPCPDLADDADALLCEVEHDGAFVTFEGDGVTADVLRAAGASVRVPAGDELAALFVDLPTQPEGPVERGDLPEGDRAPDNSVGVGG